MIDMRAEEEGMVRDDAAAAAAADHEQEEEHQPVQRLFQSCGQVHDRLTVTLLPARIRSSGEREWMHGDAVTQRAMHQAAHKADV